MRAVRTLEAPKERVASARDLRSPVISVARPILCHSSLRRVGPFCAVIVSVQIAPLSRELSIDCSRAQARHSADDEIRNTGAPLTERFVRNGVRLD